MAEVETIREMYFTKGCSVSEIAEQTGKDRKTVRKYLQVEDWNTLIHEKGCKESKLDPYKETIDSWLEADRKMRKKQRHTAKRVYDRLTESQGESGFDCSYRTVATYVRSETPHLRGAQLLSAPTA